MHFQAGEWLTSELPEELDQGATSAAHLQLALTYGTFSSKDLAIDTSGALWQSIETALSTSGDQAPLRQCRLARIEPNAKVVSVGGFDDILLEDSEKLLLEDGDKFILEDSGFHVVAATTGEISVGDEIMAHPLDGLDRPA